MVGAPKNLLVPSSTSASGLKGFVPSDAVLSNSLSWRAMPQCHGDAKYRRLSTGCNATVLDPANYTCIGTACNVWQLGIATLGFCGTSDLAEAPSGVANAPTMPCSSRIPFPPDTCRRVMEWVGLHPHPCVETIAARASRRCRCRRSPYRLPPHHVFSALASNVGIAPSRP